jgi:hypothetical protein
MVHNHVLWGIEAGTRWPLKQPQRQRTGEPDQAIIIADEFQPIGP